MSTNLTEEEFSKHIGSLFGTSLGERKVDLKLAEVKAYMAKSNEQRGLERFSVFFDGPADPRLPQQIYSLRHDKMDEFEIFLVPISGDADGFRYEAVFNYYK